MTRSNGVHGPGRARVLGALAQATVVILLLAMALPRHAHAQSFAIEDLLSYAFPSDLVTSRDGQRIAWLENEEGRRNVVVADAPQWTPRRVTSWLEDDGIELSALRFLADGRLIFMRGHTANMEGEIANPTSALERESPGYRVQLGQHSVPRHALARSRMPARIRTGLMCGIDPSGIDEYGTNTSARSVG